MKLAVFFLALLAGVTKGQVGCRPTTFYVFRHAERFIAADGNAQDDSQEVLTPEGFQRARDLRQKFIDENLALDAIFVSKEFVRSYQTAAPLEAEFQVPVHRYYAEAPGSQDLTDVIFASFPCPDNVVIVTHGDFIASVFTALGFDPTNVADITVFGKFFTLKDVNGVQTIDEDTYGVPESDGDVPWPGPAADPTLTTCFPSTLYITRHAERFAAADGNGADDSQEILTDLGFQRARDLRQAFIDNDLPLDHIFVTLEYIRTLQTASPLEALQGENAGLAPLTLYGVLQPNQVELIRRLNFLNPCPENVLIVTHGDFLPETFQAFNINPDDVPGLDIAFGLLFTVTFGNEFDDATIETTTYGADNDNPLPIPSPLPRRHPECQPSTFYIFRHAERFVANNGNGQDDSQEVLTAEGIQRSFDLRDKFINENLPIEGIYVSKEYVRSYLTIAPTEVEFQVPVTRYYAESPRDIADKIAASFPCPEHAVIVTHGNFIVDVFANLGFDASDIPGIADFGQFFTLTFDDQACRDCINVDANHKKAWCASTHQCLNLADKDVCGSSSFVQSESLCDSFAGGGRVEQSTYGSPESNDNIPWPQPAIAGLQTCQPTTFYIFRHVERFMSADGNGADDSQEIATPEGFIRAQALRDKVDQEGLPVDHIFVTLEYIRTLITAAPTEDFEGTILDGAPVTLYRALTPVQLDLRQRISRLNPCPEHVMVVTHGFFIADVFTSLGFDPNDVPELSAEFGKFFTLTFDANGVGSVDVSDFGDPDVDGNLPFPLSPDTTASVSISDALWWLIPLVGVIIVVVSLLVWRSKTKRRSIPVLQPRHPVGYQEMAPVEMQEA